MRVLVTGGSGFLGRAVCELLLRSGHSVRVLCRRDYAGPGRHIAGDLRRYQDVEAAVRGCAAVVHGAAKAGYWGSRAAFHETNVIGTAHVITACVRQGVGRLVYTSSPSVVHNGADLEGVDESVPYATTFLAPYPETKAAARRLAHAVELGYRLTGARREPPLTRFLVQQLTTAHWFDIGAARRDLGYTPRVSTAEGLALLRDHLHGRHRRTTT